MNKFIQDIDIDELIKRSSMGKIRVIVEKNCGYNFMVLLNDSAQLRDLYREVELVYDHINAPLNLYYGENYLRNNDTIVNNATTNDNKQCCKCNDIKSYDGGTKKFIPKNNIKFKDYVNQVNLGPCTIVPNTVCYRIYLDICNKH
tara:strand:+ start:550 stop:984 length:435 start_codon:yes stop_codon:yes gene_type:complete